MGHHSISMVLLQCAIRLRDAINLHSLIFATLTLTFLFLLTLIFAARALGLEILAAIVGLFGCGRGVGLHAAHLGIIYHGIWIGGCSATVFLFELKFFFFFCAVLVTVGSLVGFRLVGREFGGGRFVGVPRFMLDGVSDEGVENRPFDGESRNAWLLCQHIAAHMLQERLRRRVGV
jgi:hypothetical protein